MTQGRRPSIEFDEATLLRALAARITRSPPLAPDVPPWPGRVAPPCLPSIIRLGMSNATLLSPAPSRTFLGLAWPERLAPAERRSLVAGGLGWMLDAMDVMLYSMVLAHLMRDLGMDKATAGLLNSLTPLASALGGLVFGFVADRIGRLRSLMLSILIYSAASGACGFSETILQLAIFRFILGLGMGGE